MSGYESLPDDLPRPVDDGAADTLPGRAMPSVHLASTSGEQVDLAVPQAARTVVYAYPMTGRPGVDLPKGWDQIPGARGCTPESCAFRDHFDDLRAAGVSAVYGLSSQDSVYQREVVQRLQLPFAMLSDQRLELARLLGLPTLEGRGLYRRLTLVVRDGRIEHVFYPIFPPDQHAGQVLHWLRTHPDDGAGT